MTFIRPKLKKQILFPETGCFGTNLGTNDWLKVIIVKKLGSEKMFKLHSKYKPTGDQPKAIENLVDGINKGLKYQTLLGVTGSRKNLYNGKCYCSN